MPSGVSDLYQLLGSAQQANEKTASCFLDFMSLWHLPLGILATLREWSHYSRGSVEQGLV